MYQATAKSIAQIRRFVQERGHEYLSRYEESPVADGDWLLSSHGACIRVVGEYDSHFERLLVLIPRPHEAPAERFKSWVGERLKGLSWYMEQTNTGRCVRQQVSDNVASAIIMRRVGYLLNSPECPVPSAYHTYTLLETFIRDVRSYVRNIGDDSLKYVRSLRIYSIPKKGDEVEHLLGMDILPTLVGLQGEPVPIHPLTLVRGTIGEVAEMLDGQLETRKMRKAKTGAERKAIESVVKHLDAICMEIDNQQPDLDSVQQLLKATKLTAQPKPKDSNGLLISLLFLAVAGVVAWLELRG